MSFFSICKPPFLPSYRTNVVRLFANHDWDLGRTHCEPRKAKRGQVFIVGAGPGDADLLTVKAVKCLQQADVVMYDWLVDSSVLALIPKRTQRVFVGKRRAKHSTSQEDICKQLVEFANQGKVVVRLKGGDPAVFARTTEETVALTNAEIPFAIVPGITAASGASAFTGIPLTERSCAQSVTLLTAHLKDADEQPDWQKMVQQLSRGTLVLYMGLSKLAQVTCALIERQVAADTPVALIENACCASQRLYTTTLYEAARTAERAHFSGPVLIIVGDVVNHRQSVDTSLFNFATQSESIFINKQQVGC
ncbi:uroporphyrinogen-III C-methyltransferase [Pseudoalteromonas sp. SSDWG2]|uniref:uroporphyrinogen-III C-methyltransferase n=1 Tax=Pseudoalteromonas sp. SSDWG2 TaxID=3139391 RepID=UPI003BAC8D75